MDLAHFNSYELAAVRDRMAATARETPQAPWPQAYRAAATAGLIALRVDRTVGVWGCPHWLEKHHELRAHIAAEIPEAGTLVLAVAVLTTVVDQRLTLDEAEPF